MLFHPCPASTLLYTPQPYRQIGRQIGSLQHTYQAQSLAMIGNLWTGRIYQRSLNRPIARCAWERSYHGRDTRPELLLHMHFMATALTVSTAGGHLAKLGGSDIVYGYSAIWVKGHSMSFIFIGLTGSGLFETPMVDVVVLQTNKSPVGTWYLIPDKHEQVNCNAWHNSNSWMHEPVETWVDRHRWLGFPVGIKIYIYICGDSHGPGPKPITYKQTSTNVYKQV